MIGEFSRELGLIIAGGHCPECRAWRSFLTGPRGGLCMNIKCSQCGAKYNMSPFFGAQPIGRDEPMKVEAHDAKA
ncbi:MAG: hypothetical protein ACRER4_09070 [Steroidobacteraceae bacterium]